MSEDENKHQKHLWKNIKNEKAKYNKSQESQQQRVSVQPHSLDDALRQVDEQPEATHNESECQEIKDINDIINADEVDVEEQMDEMPVERLAVDDMPMEIRVSSEKNIRVEQRRQLGS